MTHPAGGPGGPAKPFVGIMGGLPGGGPGGLLLDMVKIELLDCGMVWKSRYQADSN